MAGTLEQTNGHADTRQPSADRAHDPTHAPPQPRREAKVQLLVKPKTHEVVRRLAKRLGRSNDAVIRRAVYLLDKETKAEQVKSDEDWANEGQSS